MARIIPNQNSYILFCASMANYNAPTQAEVQAGINLTPFIVSINASTRGNVVATPDFSTRFETNIPGTVTSTFESDMYRDDSADTAWLALPRSTSGYFVISRFGGKGGPGITLTTPTGTTVTPQGTSGSTTYSYRVSAVGGGGETLAATAATTATGNATLSPTNFNRVTWGAVANATGYNVYGRTAAGEQKLAFVLTNTFDDTGSQFYTPSGAVPGSNTTGTTTPLYSPVAGDLVEVWPTRIVARAAQNLTNNTAQMFSVQAAVYLTPNEAARIV
jgi:hypothetical protein